MPKALSMLVLALALGGCRPSTGPEFPPLEVPLPNGKVCRLQTLGLAHRADSSAKILIVAYESKLVPRDLAGLEREARDVFEPARVTCEAWGNRAADLDPQPPDSKGRKPVHPFFMFRRQPNGTWAMTPGTSTF